MKRSKENEIKSSKKRELTKLEKTINFLDKNRKMVYGFIGGVLVWANYIPNIWI